MGWHQNKGRGASRRLGRNHNSSERSRFGIKTFLPRFTSLSRLSHHLFVSIVALAGVSVICNVAYYFYYLPRNHDEIINLHQIGEIGHEMPIDLVVTWFNESDPKLPNPTNPRHQNSFYELKYSLRSFKKHGLLDQVRNVFIVYNSDYNDPPSFLQSYLPGKFKLMPHAKFQPSEFLPHNNRNPTVLSLHRIPGISKWFLKFQDDFFLTGKIDIYDYFFDLKSQKAKLIDERCPDKAATDGWIGAQSHAVEVLNNYFGKPYNYECKGTFWHTPVVFNKLIGKWFEQTFHDEFINTFSYEQNDKNVLADVVMKKMLLHLGKGAFHEFPANAEYHSNDASLLGDADCTKNPELLRRAQSHLESLFPVSPCSGCPTWVNVQGPGISDDYVNEFPPCDELRETFFSILEKVYPTAGEWEKQNKLRTL